MHSLRNRDVLAMLNKVPEVTIYFWIIKVLATTVGETAADFLKIRLHFGLTVTSSIMTVVFLASLVIQLRYRRYVPWAYWLTVVLISVVGTLISDNLVDHLGVGLQATTIAFSIVLAATFALWYWSEHTLSIHSIFTRRRELFYWAAILFTFALGTSAGDLVSERMHVGYAGAALIFAALIALVTFAYYALKTNAILAFWIAYILTRPLGASCGDFLSQPVGNGGLGLGTILTSVIFLAVILFLVTRLTFLQKKDASSPESQEA